jgi:prepilin-type processing-associated H-X9-DG protein
MNLNMINFLFMDGHVETLGVKEPINSHEFFDILTP